MANHSEAAVSACGRGELTHVHQVVVDAFDGDHFHEVVLVVSLLCHLGAVGIVFEEVVKQLGEKDLRRV